MSSKPTLDIVIVNWNSGEQLRRCVRSILNSSKDGFSLNSVIIVDNSSGDGSAVIDDLGCLPVQVIRNAENKGFSVACNQGARSSAADYLLFLNPDTELYERSLTEPVAFMERPEHSSIGICGIRLVDENGDLTTTYARFPTVWGFMLGMSGLDRLFPTYFSGNLVDPSKVRSSSDVDQVIGAFFLVRKKLYDALGGFDERFFVYYEEVDFSFRAKVSGYRSYYLDSAHAFHKGGGCSEQVKSTRLFYSLRSRLQYAHKHFSFLSFCSLLTLTLTIELVARLVKALLKLSLRQVSETIAAYARLTIAILNKGVALGNH